MNQRLDKIYHTCEDKSYIPVASFQWKDSETMKVTIFTKEGKLFRWRNPVAGMIDLRKPLEECEWEHDFKDWLDKNLGSVDLDQLNYMMAMEE